MSIPTYVGNSGVRRNMSKIRKISQNIDIRTSLIKCNQTHLSAPLSDCVINNMHDSSSNTKSPIQKSETIRFIKNNISVHRLNPNTEPANRGQLKTPQP